MKNRLQISTDLLTGIDILNTLNGGTIEPSISFSQHTEYRQIDVKAPGISEEGLHVKVENNKLIIYYEHVVESQHKPIPVPHVVYNKQIPFFIDSRNISAHYAEGVLIVHLPYNELANGYHRDVPIDS